MVFLKLRREPEVCSRVTAGVAIKPFVCSMTSGLLSRYEGHLRNVNYAWQDNTDTSGGEAGDRVSLSSWHRDIGIPIHFQEESVIVTFWSIEFRVPLEVSKRCEAPVQMRGRPTAVSRVSTRDSYMPSSLQMKDEPEFKPLQ